MTMKKYLKISLIALGLLFTLSNVINYSLADQAINTKNHLETMESITNSIENGDFELGTTDGWGLKYLKAGETNLYEVSTNNPHTGTYSYYMYAIAYNPTYRGCVIEIGQNITVNAISRFNLTGNVYVDQCTCYTPYSSWAGIYVVFYNSDQDELGRVYYRFAENREWGSHEYEIELYNQLDSWLEFNRNIAQDFVNEIGGDSSEITQIELVFKVIASDGDQSGDRGYCEAYFDDWNLEHHPVANTIANGDFESGATFGWGLKYLKAGETNQYEVSTNNPHTGTYSYYMYAVAYNPTYRGCYIEFGQNITVNAISKFNLTGYVYVDQCSSANTYPSWVGIYIVFYNNTQNELGRVYYQFASDHQYTEFDHEINLYNQLDTWLKFDRNITQDFVDEIGGDISEVSQIELVFDTHASDGDQSGDRGYCEAYFDDWNLERHPVANTIANGDFESGTTLGWGLKYLKAGETNQYEVSTNNPHTGTYSYYMYAVAYNPTYRGCYIEFGQNITVNAISKFNLTGYVYVDQCSSANTYPSWVGIYIVFYNNTQNELGRVYYQFASDHQYTEFDHEINLYNQLDTWLKFDRNITQDFVDEIGGDISEVSQIELVFDTHASDGDQSGDRGYCEAYFDDWSLKPNSIFINNNADFANLGFPGTGVLEDPYLIENYTITNSEAILIEIHNTTAYFRIKNNLLDGLERNYNGIYLHNVTHGTIVNNTIHSCKQGVTADYYSLNNTITNNFISNCASYAISIQGASDLNNVTHNTVFNSDSSGIWLESAFNTTLLNNTISTSGYDGIELLASDYNDIFNNTIINSTRYGISLIGGSAWNLIEWNDFINNKGQTSQALDDVSLSNTTFNYNYWGDWTSPDSEPNGIVDHPYLIDGNANNNDPYPLTSPNNPITDHSLSIPIVLYPNGGETISGTIEIEWSAASDTWGHLITYTVYYSADGGTTWNELASGLTTTSYDWDTTTVADGTDYLVKVNATCVEDLWKEDMSDGKFSIDNPEPTTTTSTTTTPIITTSTTTTTTSETGATSGWTFSILLLSVLTVLVLKRGMKPKSS
ncbi:MAG: NosD domain-containing protein [Promethearchaeota archaeon]